MEILKGIEIIGKCLWMKKEEVLIISDLHLGYEESFNKKGVLIPRVQFADIKKEIESILAKKKPKIVILNGDLKHEFMGITPQEWREVIELIDILKKKSELILIKGNHDNMLFPIAKRKGLEIRDFYCVKKNVCVFHGHFIPLEKEVHDCKVIIIGHEHPSISLSEGKKIEKYKCFLLGKWHKKDFIIMPSFFPYIEGFDIRNEDRISKTFKEGVEDFDVFIVGDKVYKFGKVKELKKL